MPRFGAWWRHVLLIQLARNRFERTALEVHREDAAHNRRLLFGYFDSVPDNSPVRVIHRRAGVSERKTSGRVAGKTAPFEASERLVAKVIEVEIADERLDRVRQFSVLRGGVDPVRYAQQGNA